MKRTWFVILGMIFLLTGCDYSNVGVTETVSKTDIMEDGVNLSDLEKVSYIELKDIQEEMYETSISVRLTENEIDEILMLTKNLQDADKDFTTRELYAVIVYDIDGNELNKFYVDSDYNLVSANGKRYITNREKDIQNFFEQITEKYSLNMDYVWGREPGKNYFELLDNNIECVFEKRTYTNFDEEYEYVLNSSDREKMIKLFENIKIGEKQDVDFLWKYSLEIFSKGGASLYLFRISEDNHLFNEYGYELIGKDVSSWIETLRNN